MAKSGAMETGLAPGKNIFMQGFMMDMSGSSINIWSMMVAGHAFSPSRNVALRVRGLRRSDAAQTRTRCNACHARAGLVGADAGITAADVVLVDKVDVESSGVPLTL